MSSSGTLVSTFDPSGSAYNFLGGSVRAGGAVELSDGRLAVSYRSGTSSGIVMLTAAGTVDVAFHGGSDPGNRSAAITSVWGPWLFRRTDGSFLLAGGEGGTLRAARFTSAGVLDTSFGSAGVATMTVRAPVASSTSTRMRRTA